MTELERKLMGPTAGHAPVRMRRLRLFPALREMVRETALTPADLIAPLFVRPGQGERQAISSMPGQFQWTVESVVGEARELADLGVKAIVLFGIPELKDARGSGNYDPEGVVPNAIRAIKRELPEMLLISDMCFCEYTDHGHCGIVNLPDDALYRSDLPRAYLLNDPTLELLGRASVVHAQAGADVIAPSGMVDGMVATIRTALDEAGLEHKLIMSYAVKFASSFYGPFREAAECPPQFGDRAQYQMDPGNRREALREADIDETEGADILMVKPALPFLDVIYALRASTQLPLAAYQVSGEYSMIHAAARNGWLDLRAAALESLLSIKRAGADLILTYFAKDAARWLAGRE
jgi:porphobilinogen synthase